MKRRWRGRAISTVEQLREGYTKNAIPMGAPEDIAEVADFVCYLLSERASYSTGVTTNIAGTAKRAAKEALWSTPILFLCPRQS